MLRRFLTRRYVYILVTCSLSIILSTKGITDEGNVSTGGDMPRYMMNGVYFYDLIKDKPFNNIIEYTFKYFAKYPALSLGHHPLLPSIALVPFYYLFGISVFSARLAMVFFFLIAAVTWFELIREIYDENIALLSSLLFITNPYIVRNTWIVRSEIPSLTLIIVTTYFFYRYWKLGERKYALAFVLSSVLSVYAKHTAILMFPFYFGFFLITRGIKKLFTRDILMFSSIITLLMLPLVPLTLKFSQHNVAWTKSTISSGVWLGNLLFLGPFVWKHHFFLPVLTLILISVFIILYRKQKRDITFILWILSFYLLSAYIGAPTPRHTIYWIPAFCLLATTIINASNYRLWRVSTSIVLIFIIGYQFAIVSLAVVNHAHNYEEAAKYITSNSKGDSVLYSSELDTGYFIFFVRKYDDNRNFILLRADKILATSAMGHIVEDRIRTPEEIYDVLHNFGISYIVIEDQFYDSGALELLRGMVQSDRFILRKTIPIYSSSKRWQNLTLKIYEYKGYTKARSDAVLLMNIPLMNDYIRVPFSDLLYR